MSSLLKIVFSFCSAVMCYMFIIQDIYVYLLRGLLYYHIEIP